jgi:hypothetical protein
MSWVIGHLSKESAAGRRTKNIIFMVGRLADTDIVIDIEDSSWTTIILQMEGAPVHGLYPQLGLPFIAIDLELDSSFGVDIQGRKDARRVMVVLDRSKP